MSRRFGRQQKRRMRAEIEKISYDYDCAIGLANAFGSRCEKQRDKIYELEDAVEQTAKLLGIHFAGLPPSESGGVSSGDITVVPDWHGQSSISAIYPGQSGPEVTHKLLNCLNVMPYLARDEFRKMMHFTVRIPSGELAYSISEDAIKNMQEDELARNISRILGRAVAQQLKRRMT